MPYSRLTIVRSAPRSRADRRQRVSRTEAADRLSDHAAQHGVAAEDELHMRHGLARALRPVRAVDRTAAGDPDKKGLVGSCKLQRPSLMPLAGRRFCHKSMVRRRLAAEAAVMMTRTAATTVASGSASPIGRKAPAIRTAAAASALCRCIATGRCDRIKELASYR